MAIVKPRGDKFCVVYRYVDGEGKTKQKWETFDTEKEAVKRKLEVELGKLENTLHVPTEMTFEEFFYKKFLPLHGKQKWRYSTYETNVGMIRNHVLHSFGKKKLSAITPIMIEELYAKLLEKKVSGFKAQKAKPEDLPCLSSTTVRHVHTILKKMFTKAVQWRFLAASPVTCEAPKARKVEREIWNGSNFSLALNDMGDDELLRLAVHTAFVGALRSGEVVGLTWDCVNLDQNEYRVNKSLQRVTLEALELLPKDDLIFVFPKVTPKSKSVLVLKKPKTEESARTIPFTDELKQDLLLRKKQIEKDKAYYGDSYQDYNLVFCFEDGRPVEPKRCAKWFKVWQERTGLDLNTIVFHGIRHSSATYYLKLSNGDVKTVQGYTGHKTAAQVTDIYSHIVENDKAQLQERFSEDFYGHGDAVKENNFSSLKALIKLAKSDPGMREELLNALNADKDIIPAC